MSNQVDSRNLKQTALNHARSRNADLVNLLTPITAEDLRLVDNGTLDSVIECPKLDWAETVNFEWANNFRSDDFNIDFNLVLAEFEAELEDERLNQLHEIGLSFEAVNIDLHLAEITFDFLFSWGGPSETLRFKLNADGKDTTPYEIEFVYKNWFQSEGVNCSCEELTGLTDFAYFLAEFAPDMVQKKLEEIGLI
jgi:hypothetical protein